MCEKGYAELLWLKLILCWVQRSLQAFCFCIVNQYPVTFYSTWKVHMYSFPRFDRYVVRIFELKEKLSHFLVFEEISYFCFQVPIEYATRYGNETEIWSIRTVKVIKKNHEYFAGKKTREPLRKTIYSGYAKRLVSSLLLLLAIHFEQSPPVDFLLVGEKP